MGKTNFKRLLCFVLSLVMVFALAVAPAYAEEETDTEALAGETLAADNDSSITAAETSDSDTEGAFVLMADANQTEDSAASVTIGGTTLYYNSVSEALSALTDEATLVILQECDTDITVASGQTITLDLQTDYHGDITIASGGELIFSSTYDMMGGSVTVEGTLTVEKGAVGSTTLKDGAVMTISGGGAQGVSVNDGATLTVSGGSVSSLYGLTINGGTVEISSGSASDVTISGGSLTISGGTVSEVLTVNGGEVAITGGTVTADTVFTVAGGTVTISGGTVRAAVEVSDGDLTVSDDASLKGGITLSGSGSVAITGGTVTMNGNGAEVTITVAADATGSLAISGGTIDNNSEFNSDNTLFSIADDTQATVTITGGTFTGEVESYIDTDSYSVTANEDGTYTVSENVTTVYVATVTDKSGNVTYYTTLAAAVEYANSLATGSSSNTTTITLQKDITLTEQVALENAGTSVRVYLTLDLDGHTITADVKDGYALYIKSTHTDGYGKITVENGTITATANAYGAIEIDHGAAILTSLTLSSRTAGHGTILVDSVTGTASEFTDLTITTTDGYCLEVNNSSNTAALKLSGKQTYTQIASDEADSSQLNACVYLHGSTGMSASAQTGSEINWSSDGYGVYISGNRVYFNKTVSGKIEGKTKGIYVDSSYDDSTYAAVTVVAASTIAVDGGIESAASAYDNYAIAISGGNYEYDLNDSYVASGYECVQDSDNTSDTYGRYIIQEVYVAEVYNGTTLIGSYNSLSGAISAATSGYTVKLIKDCTGSSTITISKNLTIDLNGNTYTYTGSSNAFTLNNSNYTVTITDTSNDGDGKIEATASNAIAVVVKRGTLNVEGKATISASSQGIQLGGYSSAYSSSIKAVVNVKDNATVYGGETGVGIYGSTSSSATANSYGPTLNVTGGTVSGGYYGISGQGSTTYKGNTFINISGGTVVGTGSGIYHPQLGTLTVSGGTITGEDAGIEMRAGTLNVSGGEITSTSTDATTYVANGSGTTVVGAGIAISQHSTNNAITLNVTGGTISGATGIYEVNTFAGTNTSAVTINISEADTATPTIVKSIVDGGTAVKSESVNGETTGASSITTVAISGGHFSSEVDEAYCAEGYAPATETEETYAGIMYTVKEAENVASVTTTDDEGTENVTKYTALDTALAAAVDGDTVTLLKDITVESDLTAAVDGSVTLDLAGCDLTINSGVTLTVDTDTTVTIVDSASAGLVTNNGTISVSGTLDIRDLAYTTDADNGYGLLGQTDGKTVMASTGVFIVPDAWNGMWNSSAWDPNWTSATGSYTYGGTTYTGIFSSLSAGAKVYSFGVGYECTTAFEQSSYDSNTTYWELSGTYLVEYFKTNRGGNDIDVDDSSTWTYPTVDTDTIFAGWYDADETSTVYDATSGEAYAKFVNLKYSSSNGGIIRYLGGSLRMDYTDENGDPDYSQTSLRFGYDIVVPTDCDTTYSWYWEYTLDGYSTVYNVEGTEKGTATAQSAAIGNTIFRSNLVITGIPAKYYDMNITSTLYVTYATGDGTTVIAVRPTSQITNVEMIARYMQSGGTEDEKTYAVGILAAMTEETAEASTEEETEESNE